MRRLLTLLHRPFPALIALLVTAQMLFCWRLTTPHKLVFDEVHYVPAARTLLALEGPVNIEHPLLGKALIALGMMIFGDNPLGWRALSTLAGTAVVAGVFGIVWLMTRRTRTAAMAGVLTLANFMVLIQARIAMLDGFMAAFVVLAVAAMGWSMRGSVAQSRWRWTLGAVLLGLAVGTKWAAVPYLGYAAIGFVLMKRGDASRWPGLHWWSAWGLLGLGAGLAYAATFAPAFFYTHDPMTLGRLLPFQAEMYARQTQILPPHTYQSTWWSWPVIGRPIWYFYEVADGAQRGIFLLGNPVVMWGGLVAVAACTLGWLRTRDIRLGFAAALWIGGFAVWAIIPKSLGFYYYYYLPAIWLSVALAVAIDRWRGALRDWDEAYLVAAVCLCVYFYPILTAGALAGPRSFLRWAWFTEWR
ncbi:phospholipid carrier-dependent glycosyltransferase [Sphingomonas sanguinis]|jgi:dolichyl-phosphate-mannose-protein mannosyltransferase|uniref:Polyprenol-phosphate-mannose--protein mannosyltransferase n=1 Tax=Sphingomonas sanguinis TaxID=33051 RepID=A0A7Y7QVF5_9SPHN|nr:phospholipid carrier-dependent glycosyltransferase [Sphingomonas sanguinis]MBZ6382092.1 phospholipid carrier-dependent glycosyltransferase [Sphingomonas sanguinis]NNG49101.1 phospholipid carrier-dependent glycosyltransferase [Sphingomonas sanguinis]NNG52648.1 phospholipid carrier-dependent glycosyltransferase [Sphingomonas sanguinis]NVP31391.1 phospholipid carrier-dependent glycosyltransferase [Sphingomonas sanguinis]